MGTGHDGGAAWWTDWPLRATIGQPTCNASKNNQLQARPPLLRPQTIAAWHAAAADGVAASTCEPMIRWAVRMTEASAGAVSQRTASRNTVTAMGVSRHRPQM